MSTDPNLKNNYKTWDVRLLWNVKYPSSLYASTVVGSTFEIFGVDRSAATISRPLTKINSLEVYGQGWIDGVPDIRVTIFAKESGPSFEQMRRLSASKIPFDVYLTLAADNTTEAGNLENNPHEGIWIDGYEEYLGCRVTTERTNQNIAEFPVREFECVALRHRILDSSGLATVLGADFDIMIEGDGTYATSLPTKTT